MVQTFRSDVARLWETAEGAPFFANSLVIHSTGRLRRGYLEIMLVTRGTGRLFSYPEHGAEASRVLRPGTMLLFRPSDTARIATTDAEGIATLYVSFSEADWASYAGLVGLHPSWATVSAPPAAALDPADAAVFGPFLAAIDRFHHSPTTLDLVRFLSAVVEQLFPSYGHADPGRSAPDWLMASLDAMQEESNLRVGLPRFVELAHVTSSYLSVSVRRHFGSTPTALLMDLRLRRAALLLATTQESVKDVAARCGFDNVTYFSTCFRRQHALSPREYRSRSRGGGLGLPG